MIINFKRLFILILAANIYPTSDSCADSVVKGDIAYGEYLSSECVTCHRQSGNSQGIPSITGWEPNDFVDVINMYKSKERANPVMQLVASRLTDEQIASLAVYFAKIPAGK
ncbi:MAG: hypothetical protein CFH06_00369 [Alphaproteobacteria bacterium MarineAlpha3_Bin5]|nr:hypothetical protein [Magnetovibrio sp.]PPR79406.1 MAG: hypothetical protein CFH06_00369 [Alphaproteobacteria bacterium MarineAlpha3_Bin5]|tara:strand:- start:279 stop:611 length:333 start_codon:yes stop_codon:yes gene_type:complete